MLTAIPMKESDEEVVKVLPQAAEASEDQE